MNNLAAPYPQQGGQMTQPATGGMNPLAGIESATSRRRTPTGSTGGTPYVPQPMEVTPDSMEYMHGILTTQIGKKVTVDFLIGSNTLTDRTGTLLAVGINYIVLREIETDDLLICDFYTIKFVTIYY